MLARIAFAIPIVGFASAVVNDWVYARYSHLANVSGDHSLDIVVDLLASLPFLVITAVLVARKIGTGAAAIATVAVVVTLSYGYYVAATSSNSFSAVAIFIGSYVYGLGALIVVAVIDRIWSMRAAAARPPR